MHTPLLVIIYFCKQNLLKTMFSSNTHTHTHTYIYIYIYIYIQGGSNITGTVLCVNKSNQSRSYLNHLVYIFQNSSDFCLYGIL